MFQHFIIRIKKVKFQESDGQCGFKTIWPINQYSSACFLKCMLGTKTGYVNLLLFVACILIHALSVNPTSRILLVLNPNHPDSST